MKTIKSLKEITTLEVDDEVVFGDLRYVVDTIYHDNSTHYYLYCSTGYNGIIFEKLNLKKRDFTEKLGIDAKCTCNFPETKSLEALTAIVSALFKEYEKQNELPQTWEEFCERNPIKEEETFINSASGIVKLIDHGITRTCRFYDYDKNVCTSKQEAEAFLALMQLRQLRKAYVKDWEPDWTDNTESKYCLDLQSNNFSILCLNHTNHPLSFPTKKLAIKFFNNFKDLLEVAKPLL